MDSSSNSNKTVITPRSISEFMSGLQRLFKIGVYYPDGHEILETATRTYLGLLRNLAADKPGITIKKVDRSLEIAGLSLPPKHPFSQEFINLLSDVGIEEITFEKHLSSSELHEFVRKLLTFKHDVTKSRKFTTVMIDALPTSIQVRKREYVARKMTGTQASDYEEGHGSFKELSATLKEHGFSQGEIARCQEIIQAIPKHPHTAGMPSNLPMTTWDDVAGLLKKMIHNGSMPATPGASAEFSLNALQTLLQQHGSEESNYRVQKLIELLISSSHPTVTPQTAKIEKTNTLHQRPPLPDTPAFSIDELQQFVQTNKLKPKIVEQLPLAPAETETLSILLQFARQPIAPASQQQLETFLRKILAGKVTERIWVILRKGLSEIVSDNDERTISPILPLALRQLRQSQGGLNYTLLLYLVKESNRDNLPLLWPYIVNELLLIGNPDDNPDYSSLFDIAATLPADGMTALKGHLARLEAFKSKKIGAQLSRGVKRPGFLLFAFLLGTERKHEIGSRLLSEFLQSPPPDPLIIGLIPLLDPDKAEHLAFLRTILAQTAKGQLSERVKHGASQFIIQSLKKLHKDQRSESWVSTTVATLAMTPSQEVLEFLKEISSSRKALLLHEWPLAVREAAEKAHNFSSKQKSRRRHYA